MRASITAGDARRSPAAIVPVLLVLAGCPTPGGEDPDPQAPSRPNFLVVDLESLRADHLLRHEGGEPLAPTLHALARRGVVFEQAYAQSGITWGGLAALLTGRHPPPLENLGRRFTAPISAEHIDSLPEILALYDYHTAVFWGRTMPIENPEFSSGFQHVQISGEQGSAADYVDPVQAWLAQVEPPFFALVHNFDLHGPQLGVPGEWIPEGARMVDRRASLTRRHHACVQVHGQERAWALSRATYAAYLRYYDRVLSRILAVLESAGHAESTVVIVTSNHAEDLGEHLRAPGHSVLYDTVLHVPLLWMDPERPGGGRRVAPGVQTVDIAPTLLDRAGVVPAAGMTGRSLVPLLEDTEETWEPAPVFSLTNARTSSLRTERYKLLRCSTPIYPDPPEGEPAEWFELYDLVADPDEQVDLMDTHTARALPLLQRLLDWHAALSDTATGSSLSPEEQDRLRKALHERGYWKVVP